MKLIRNYLYNASYQVLILITPLITVPYVARVLGPNGVGIYSYTNSIITYFVLIGTLGITVYGNQQVAFHRDDIFERSKTFWEIEILQAVNVAIVFLFFGGFMVLDHRYRLFMIFQAFQLLAGAFDVSWFFMGIEDFKKTVFRNTLVKLATLASIFIFVKSRSDLGLYILILALSQLLGNFTLWPYLKNNVVFVKPRKLNVWKHYVPALMLFVPQAANLVYQQVNKTMLGNLDSVSSVAYFDYADKLIKTVLAVVTATGIVMLPHMANLYVKGKLEEIRHYLYKSFEFVSFIAIPLMFGISGIATALAPWYFGRDFTVSGLLLIIESPVIILIGWSNVIGQQYMMPTKQIPAYTKSVILGAIVNIVFNIPLIMWLGAVGAPIATVAAELAVTIYQLVSVRKQLTIKYLFTDLGKYLIAGVVMFFGVYFLNITMNISVLSLLAQITEGVLIYSGILLILQPNLVLEGKDMLLKKFSK
ncbi:oligosaccharide flippase family protein [Lactiplantibacillus daowaiensis]|uniref:Polysaccharide biosynthesis C-terminal domain-containing protein n=1 Tax=Lactiplantibacillus daowaiensis TaxID=2559918 RepID=A0ABW1RX80_9LACO|nr:polysaccharide biosynthesis C-terminal domain-containing protein [Lactiplantibacillus daowaiensis]